MAKGGAVMLERSSLVKELNRFSRVLVTDYPSSDALHDLVEATITVLEIHGAGASLVTGDRLTFATASWEDVAALEHVQEREQQGPCVEAFQTGRPVLVADLEAAEGRWPHLTEVAAATGIRSVGAVPLRVDGTCLGALDLYDTEPHLWNADEVEAAELLAALTTSHLTATSQLDRARRTAEQLQEALDSRVIIEQAKGLLAGERGISPDQAFELIRTQARNNSAPLRDVSHAIVHLGLRP